MFTTVLLTEKALSDHDVQRVAHLHDPEPVHVHVLVPSHDDHSELADAVDDITRTDFADVLHEGDAGPSEAELTGAAGREVAASVAALQAAGVVQVDGEVADGNPVERVAAVARALGADEVIVFTEPHLLADWTRRDWASKLRHTLDLPVLHVVLGTDQVVS